MHMRAFFLLCAAATCTAFTPKPGAVAPPKPTKTTIVSSGGTDPEGTNSRRNQIIGGLLGGYILVEFGVGLIKDNVKDGGGN